jgi:hypothetical protein
MKKITKAMAELWCFKVDSEGLDYAANNYMDDAEGTSLGPVVKAYLKASADLEKGLEELREKFDIQEA